jgi:hypothetical protein
VAVHGQVCGGLVAPNHRHLSAALHHGRYGGLLRALEHAVHDVLRLLHCLLVNAIKCEDGDA